MLNTGVFEGILEIEGMSSSSRCDTVACSTRFSADVCFLVDSCSWSDDNRCCHTCHLPCLSLAGMLTACLANLPYTGSFALFAVSRMSHAESPVFEATPPSRASHLPFNMGLQKERQLPAVLL